MLERRRGTWPSHNQPECRSACGCVYMSHIDKIHIYVPLHCDNPAAFTMNQGVETVSAVGSRTLSLQLSRQPPLKEHHTTARLRASRRTRCVAENKECQMRHCGTLFCTVQQSSALMNEIRRPAERPQNVQSVRKYPQVQRPFIDSTRSLRLLTGI